MRIQHNISSLNAQRNYANNNTAMSKNIEKLSSGYRINRAGDDAAGLAISEKMRGQIRGLNQATSNANDGISLIQTAEGALNETHSILQRMRELAVQSSNGTYQNAVDRENLNKEVTALKSEIDRISTSTHFNKIQLLDGSIGGPKTSGITSSATGFDSLSISGGKLSTADKFKVAFTAATGTLAVSDVNDGSAVAGVSFDNVTGAEANGVYTMKAKVDKTTATAEDAARWEGVELSIKMGSGTLADVAATDITVTEASKGLTFQIGANGSDDQKVTLNVADMSSKGIGVDTISVSSQADANSAIQTIDDAINKVSGTRADLGALQNRLEYTVNNLSTTAENLTSAESRIRDCDMAKEMSEMTKNSILAQAAQSMLAQANSSPQGVLQLLQ